MRADQVRKRCLLANEEKGRQKILAGKEKTDLVLLALD
jgi:hypothetical protein